LGKYEPIQRYTEKPISIKLYEILNASQRVGTFYYKSIVYTFLNKIKEAFKIRGLKGLSSKLCNFMKNHIYTYTQIKKLFME